MPALVLLSERLLRSAKSAGEAKYPELPLVPKGGRTAAPTFSSDRARSTSSVRNRQSSLVESDPKGEPEYSPRLTLKRAAHRVIARAR